VKVGAPVAISVEGREVEGKVVAVLGSVDPATRRVPVQAEVRNDPKRPILAGTFVRGTVAGLKPIDVLRLPSTTLRPGSQDEVVVAAAGKMQIRHIAFVEHAGSLLVRSGIEAGDAVIVSPPAEAIDGAAVELADGAPDTTKGAKGKRP
jgi:multidrug efflux pump subunit AcrA (membrane-fusion protein)